MAPFTWGVLDPAAGGKLARGRDSRACSGTSAGRAERGRVGEGRAGACASAGGPGARHPGLRFLETGRRDHRRALRRPGSAHRSHLFSALSRAGRGLPAPSCGRSRSAGWSAPTPPGPVLFQPAATDRERSFTTTRFCHPSGPVLCGPAPPMCAAADSGLFQERPTSRESGPPPSMASGLPADAVPRGGVDRPRGTRHARARPIGIGAYTGNPALFPRCSLKRACPPTSWLVESSTAVAARRGCRGTSARLRFQDPDQLRFSLTSSRLLEFARHRVFRGQRLIAQGRMDDHLL